jgi:(p)ppGpp synthase/HD superfamily hydrolase
VTELGERFGDAFVYASRVHRSQYRKGDSIPYIAHLLAVAALVIEAGADEDQAIAALLHDAPEDQGGRARLDDIRKRFGARVAQIVEDCSDTFEQPKPPWRPRKERYVEHLRLHATDDALVVVVADKLHNARSLVDELRRDGARVWTRFNAGRDEQLWYYRALAEVFSARGAPYADTFVATVSQLAALSRLSE